jgi:hypothetical protein
MRGLRPDESLKHSERTVAACKTIHKSGGMLLEKMPMAGHFKRVARRRKKRL